uniref:Uncharacterized protein n=1 Tax=Mycena chlorophos TaxID=658473 RepID=A0ABQ0KYN9_MYCCL|nr:predicted protein [Mycena chlorophos]
MPRSLSRFRPSIATCSPRYGASNNPTATFANNQRGKAPCPLAPCPAERPPPTLAAQPPPPPAQAAPDREGEPELPSSAHAPSKVSRRRAKGSARVQPRAKRDVFAPSTTQGARPCPPRRRNDPSKTCSSGATRTHSSFACRSTRSTGPASARSDADTSIVGRYHRALPLTTNGSRSSSSPPQPRYARPAHKVGGRQTQAPHPTVPPHSTGAKRHPPRCQAAQPPRPKALDNANASPERQSTLAGGNARQQGGAGYREEVRLRCRGSCLLDEEMYKQGEGRRRFFRSSSLRKSATRPGDISKASKNAQAHAKW